MLRLAVLDANVRLDGDESYTEVVSVVGQWLQYEIARAGLAPVAPRDADLILLDHAGELDWRAHCARALRTHRIDPDPDTRAGRPYVIAGGAIDTAPLTALGLADALAVGEAYRFVRALLALVKTGVGIPDVRAFIVEYPHAIERSQIVDLTRDPAQPWLLAETPPALASPDDWVDWGDMPAPTSDDGVTRILAAKGCWLRCQFCATAYRQTYRVHDDPPRLLAQMRAIKTNGGRVSLITNDAAALPFLPQVIDVGMLQFQSMTVKSLRNPAMLDAVLDTHMKIVRFGVEGISERLRRAFGKYVSNDELLFMLRRMRAVNQDVHLFFIVGAPYENADDWQSFYQLLHHIVTGQDEYRCRIKCTAFNPQAPAPLAYFLPGSAYWMHWQRLMAHLCPRMRNDPIKLIAPRHPERRRRAFRDMFALDARQARRLFLESELTDVLDLAPSLDAAARMPWEIIAWPLDAARRWRLSRSYQKQLSHATATSHDQP